MVKVKKVSNKVAPSDEPELPAQEGNIDPYASGVSIPNPEPNNGSENRPADEEAVAPGEPAPEVANSDAEEQDEVAEGREEPEGEAEPETPEEPEVPEEVAPEALADEFTPPATEGGTVPESDEDSEKPSEEL